MPDPHATPDRAAISIYANSGIHWTPIPARQERFGGLEMRFSSVEAAVTLRDLLNRWIEAHDA